MNKYYFKVFGIQKKKQIKTATIKILMSMALEIIESDIWVIILLKTEKNLLCLNN